MRRLIDLGLAAPPMSGMIFNMPIKEGIGALKNSELSIGNSRPQANGHRRIGVAKCLGLSAPF